MTPTPRHEPSTGTTVARGGAALAGAGAVAGAGNYATNLVLARRLDPVAFGDATVVVTLMLLLTCVAGGMQLATARRVSNGGTRADHDDRRRAWTLGTVVAVAIIAAAPLLASTFRAESALLFIAFALAVPFQLALAVERGLLQGHLRFGPLAGSYLVETVTRLVATVAIVELLPRAEAAALGLVATFVVGHRYTRLRQPAAVAEPTTVSAGRSAGDLAGPTLLLLGLVVVGSADVLVVKQGFEPGQAGRYAVVALVGRALLFVGAALANAVFPVVARAPGTPAARRAVTVAIGVLVGLGGLAASVATVAGRPMVEAFFGGAHRSAGDLLTPYLLATTAIAAVHVLAAADLAAGSSRAARLVLAAAAVQTAALALVGDTLGRVVGIRLVGALVLLAAVILPRRRRPAGPRRVLLLGTHGQANVGDELLLHTFLAQLGDGHEYAVNSYDPEATTEAIDDRFDVDVFDTATARLGLVHRLWSADVVVFAGGSIVKELNPATGRRRYSTLLMVLAVVTFARRVARTPVLMANIGVGPLPSPRGRALARRILGQVDLVAVRDRGSADVCASVGVRAARLRVVPDAVYANPTSAFVADATRTSRSRPLQVAVNLNHDVEDERAWVGFLARLRLSLQLAALDGPVELVGLPMQSSFKPDHDRAVLQEFLATVGLPHRVAEVTDHHDAARVIRESDVVVAERLHTIVLASILGTPAIALPYSVKVRELAHGLGLAHRAFDVQRSFDPADLTAQIWTAAREGGREGARLQALADANRDELAPYFAAVRAWIDEPQAQWTIPHETPVGS